MNIFKKVIKSAGIVVFIFFTLVYSEKREKTTMSSAMKRYRTQWGNIREVNNEFYTKFLYSHATGLGMEAGVTRRDPTTVIKVDDTYYVWYTRSEGDQPPVGSKKASKECYDEASPRIRATPWDYASIWYATSKDGFNWKEQGVAVTPGPKGNFDCRSVFTPDVMFINGKYYLYYQSINDVSEDPTVIGMSWTDSPDGPWHRHDEPVLEPAEGTRVCHDPNLIFWKGKYWLYYKGHPVVAGENIPNPCWGVAIAEHPEGPFIKSELNPITNSGHEVLVWPYRDGVAALVCRNGYEKNSIQFARDGLNFEIKATVRVPPIAPGAYIPDKYTNTTNGEGFTWGLCHVKPTIGHQEAFLIRFDCDLSHVEERPRMKASVVAQPACQYFAPGNTLEPSVGWWQLLHPEGN